jgi:hypothetical protein
MGRLTILDRWSNAASILRHSGELHHVLPRHGLSTGVIATENGKFQRITTLRVVTKCAFLMG